MKTFTSVAALLLLPLLTSCGSGKPANLLIGQWNASAVAGAAANPYCPTPLVFTGTTYTMPDSLGKPETIAITYVTGTGTTFPATVYVMSDAGVANHVTYIFSSQDQMTLDNALQCAYTRA